MENIATNFNKLYQKAEQYSKTTLELVKLKTVDKTSDIISSITVSIIMILFVAMFALFLNIGVALWLGTILENSYSGFFIVGGLYFVFGLIVYYNRKKLIKAPVDDYIIKKLLESNSTENDINIPN